MAANLTRRFPTHFISARRPNRMLPSINRDSPVHPLIRLLTTSIHLESDLAIKKEETEAKEAAAVKEEGSGEEEEEEGDEGGDYVNKETGEVGGPKGPEPTRIPPLNSQLSEYYSSTPLEAVLWHISRKIATACPLYSGDPSSMVSTNVWTTSSSAATLFCPASDEETILVSSTIAFSTIEELDSPTSSRRRYEMRPEETNSGTKCGYCMS
ncbi:hypothetical protein AKJ16_DCAP01204 [Drosera capensis]